MNVIWLGFSFLTFIFHFLKYSCILSSVSSSIFDAVAALSQSTKMDVSSGNIERLVSWIVDISAYIWYIQNWS